MVNNYLIIGSSSGIGNCFKQICINHNFNIITMNRRKDHSQHIFIDFSDFNTLQPAINKLKEYNIILDFVCLFSGIHNKNNSNNMSKNGIEIHLQVNFIAPVIFFMMLYDNMLINSNTISSICSSRADSWYNINYYLNKCYIINNSFLNYSRSKFYINSIITYLSIYCDGMKIRLVKPLGQVNTAMNNNKSIIERLIGFIKSYTPETISQFIFNDIHNSNYKNKLNYQLSNIFNYIKIIKNNINNKMLFYNNTYNDTFIIAPLDINELSNIVKVSNELNISILSIGHGCSFYYQDKIINNTVFISYKNFNNIEYNSNHFLLKIGSGITIKQCIDELYKHGHMLRDVGSHSIQNMVGAISTGTHGTTELISESVIKMEYINKYGELQTTTDKNINKFKLNMGELGYITNVYIKTVVEKITRIYIYNLSISSFIHNINKIIGGSSLIHFNINGTMYVLVDIEIDGLEYSAYYDSINHIPKNIIIKYIHKFLRDKYKKYSEFNLSIAIPLKYIEEVLILLTHMNLCETVLQIRYLRKTNILLAPNYKEHVFMIEFHSKYTCELNYIYNILNRIHNFKFHLGKYHPIHWKKNRYNIISEFYK
jgi:short-subunit dehydrogenase